MPSRAMDRIMDDELREREGGLKISSLGRAALHVAAECFLVGLLKHAGRAVRHAGRDTLLPRDIAFVRQVLEDLPVDAVSTTTPPRQRRKQQRRNSTEASEESRGRANCGVLAARALEVAIRHYPADHADVRPIARRTADALASSKRQALAEAVPEAAGAGAPSAGGASDRSSLVVDLEAA